MEPRVSASGEEGASEAVLAMEPLESVRPKELAGARSQPSSKA